MKKENVHQDMYFLTNYDVSYVSGYGDIIISAKYGEKTLIITFPKGDKLIEELERQRKVEKKD